MTADLRRALNIIRNRNAFSEGDVIDALCTAVEELATEREASESAELASERYRLAVKAAQEE